MAGFEPLPMSRLLPPKRGTKGPSSSPRLGTSFNCNSQRSCRPLTSSSSWFSIRCLEIYLSWNRRSKFLPT